MKYAQSLEYESMPVDGGQIVAISYACDDDGIYRRTHDQSDDSVSYDFAPYTGDDDDSP